MHLSASQCILVHLNASQRTLARPSWLRCYQRYSFRSSHHSYGNTPYELFLGSVAKWLCCPLREATSAALPYTRRAGLWAAAGSTRPVQPRSTQPPSPPAPSPKRENDVLRACHPIKKTGFYEHVMCVVFCVALSADLAEQTSTVAMSSQATYTARGLRQPRPPLRGHIFYINHCCIGNSFRLFDT